MTTWSPPTPAEVDARIAAMVRVIVHEFDPDKIILFGSRARGDAGPDSDVDILVVLETAHKGETTVKIGAALHDSGLPKDIVVVTPSEFEKRKNLIGSIAYPAHHEGRVLYERA